MCGRYLLLTDDQILEIKDIVAEAERRATLPLDTGEICPQSRVPVLKPGPGGQLEAWPMVWGIPGWAKKRKDGTGYTQPNLVINTRGETAAQSPFWRGAIRKGRVIVPTSGFIEWKRTEKRGRADRYLFNGPEAGPLYLAGVYAPVETEAGIEDHFSIVTTAANRDIEDVHDRMPVVLLRSEFSQWLAGDWQALVDRQKIRLSQVLRQPVDGPEQLCLF